MMAIVNKKMDPLILENDETLSAYKEVLCSIVSDQSEVIV
jgi:hypothetical protein